MKPRLHATDISIFDQCEQRFFLEKVLGNEAPPTHYVVVGQVYHRAIALSFPAPAIYHGRFELASEMAVSENVALLEQVGVDAKHLETEVAVRIGALRRLFPDRPLYPEKVEEKFTIGRHWEGTADWVSKLYVAGDERVRGEAPLWAEGEDLAVIDWKTIHGKRRRTIRDARFSPQLALYSLAMGAKHAAFIEVPRDPTRPFVFLPVHYTPEDLTNWRLWFEKRRLAISRRRSPDSYKRTSRSDPLCSSVWCPQYFRCYPTPFLADPPAEPPEISDGDTLTEGSIPGIVES